MSKVIVALDVPSAAEARQIVETLGDAVDHYKVGLQLLTAAGPDFVRHLVQENKKLFLDLKLFEIPNSVRCAVEAAGRLGVAMITVHASGGRNIMKAAVEAARPFPHLEILALTVVTSLTDEDLQEVGIHATCEQQVLRLARLAQESGCHGLVASPAELPALRRFSSEMKIVTPGIRLADDKSHELRSDTPQAAFENGASYIVMGRSILESGDPRRVLSSIL